MPRLSSSLVTPQFAQLEERARPASAKLSCCCCCPLEQGDDDALAARAARAHAALMLTLSIKASRC